MKHRNHGKKRCYRADGILSRITHTGEVNSLLNILMQKEWVVYSKPCLQHAEKPIKTTRTAAFEGIPCSCGTGMLRVSYRLVPWQLDYGWRLKGGLCVSQLTIKNDRWKCPIAEQRKRQEYQ